jgi:ribonuclease R
MEVNDEGHVVRSSIYPSVIKSIARLTYTTVSKVIENQQIQLVESRVGEMLMTAYELSKIVRKNRYARGALD